MIDIEILNNQPVEVEVKQQSAQPLQEVEPHGPNFTTWRGILGRPFSTLGPYFDVAGGELELVTAGADQQGNYLPVNANGLYAVLEPLRERVANVKDGKDGKDGRDGVDGKDFKFEDFTPAQLERLKGPKGDTGAAFTYSMFTPAQLEALRGPAGPQGQPGESIKGDKGEPFRYSDFTQAQLEALRGPQGPQGQPGPKGEPGTIDERTQAVIVAEVLGNIPEWAKAAEKPSYTAQEVGALPSSTKIPAKISDLTADSTHRTVTDAEKTAWNAKADAADIPTDEHINSLINTALGVIENGTY